jgi:hypothetical protein
MLLNGVFDATRNFTRIKGIKMNLEHEAAALAIKHAQVPLRISYLLDMMLMTEVSLPHVYAAVCELCSDADEAHAIRPVESYKDKLARPLAELYLIAMVTRVGWRHLPAPNIASIGWKSHAAPFAWWKLAETDDEHGCFIRAVVSNLSGMYLPRVENMLRVAYSPADAEPTEGESNECKALRRTMRHIQPLSALRSSTFADEIFKCVEPSWGDMLRVCHLVTNSKPCCLSGLPISVGAETTSDLTSELDALYATQLLTQNAAFATKVRLQLFVVKQETSGEAQQIGLQQYHQFVEDVRAKPGTLFADEPARDMYTYGPFVLPIEMDIVEIYGPMILVQERKMFGTVWNLPCMSAIAYRPSMTGNIGQRWQAWQTFANEHIAILQTRRVMTAAEAENLMQQVNSHQHPPAWWV